MYINIQFTKSLWATILFGLLALNVSAQNDSAPDMEEMKKLAGEKARSLSYYIKTIGEKSKSHSEKKEAIEAAIKLFVHREAIVEVSSKYHDKKVQRTIDKYLEHLMFLKYVKVEVEWFNIYYFGDIEKTPDGKYFGTVTFSQKFRGTTSEGFVYEDITKKNIKIEIDMYDMIIKGEKVKKWDVRLSDISVEETS